MAEVVGVVRNYRDEQGLEDGPHAGVPYLHTTADVGDDRRRYEWDYDCGCRFVKLRRVVGCRYLYLSESWCPTHQEEPSDG